MLTALVALAAAVAAGPLDGKVVVLDPGHNGGYSERIDRQVHVGGGMYKACNTSGTSTSSGYAESRFTLTVAREAARVLRERGAEVVLTRRRYDGVGPCITKRAAIANRSAADAAVSIHADGGPPGGRGFHVIRPTLIEGLTDDIYAPSRRLARDMRLEYEAVTGLPRSTYAGGGGLVARSDLGGLRLADVPAIFVETANMRNGADAAKVRSPRFRKRIALGIAEGVTRYLKRASIQATP